LAGQIGACARPAFLSGFASARPIRRWRSGGTGVRVGCIRQQPRFSDDIGAVALIDDPPRAQWLLADRCPTAFFSAIALVATVIFWL
jgi:hypothetical protein